MFMKESDYQVCSDEPVNIQRTYILLVWDHKSWVVYKRTE